MVSVPLRLCSICQLFFSQISTFQFKFSFNFFLSSFSSNFAFFSLNLTTFFGFDFQHGVHQKVDNRFRSSMQNLWHKKLFHSWDTTTLSVENYQVTIWMSRFQLHFGHHNINDFTGAEWCHLGGKHRLRSDGRSGVALDAWSIFVPRLGSLCPQTLAVDLCSWKHDQLLHLQRVRDQTAVFQPQNEHPKMDQGYCL